MHRGALLNRISHVLAVNRTRPQHDAGQHAGEIHVRFGRDVRSRVHRARAARANRERGRRALHVGRGDVGNLRGRSSRRCAVNEETDRDFDELRSVAVRRNDFRVRPKRCGYVMRLPIAQVRHGRHRIHQLQLLLVVLIGVLKLRLQIELSAGIQPQPITLLAGVLPPFARDGLRNRLRGLIGLNPGFQRKRILQVEALVAAAIHDRVLVGTQAHGVASAITDGDVVPMRRTQEGIGLQGGRSADAGSERQKRTVRAQGERLLGTRRERAVQRRAACHTLIFHRRAVCHFAVERPITQQSRLSTRQREIKRILNIGARAANLPKAHFGHRGGGSVVHRIAESAEHHSVGTGFVPHDGRRLVFDRRVLPIDIKRNHPLVILRINAFSGDGEVRPDAGGQSGGGG